MANRRLGCSRREGFQKPRESEKMVNEIAHSEIARMLTLIHAPRSRSTGCLWLLEEIGEPYNIHYVSIRRGDGSGELDIDNPHPHGKVPVLKDNASVVFEQAAVALYLADRFPAAGLGPSIGDAGRAEFLTMLAYYCGVVEPAFTSKFLNVIVPRGTAGWVSSDETMKFVNAQLAAHPYIAGERFTAADVLYAGAFALFLNSPLLADAKTKALEDYVARCTARPARARALAKDNKPS
jgi:glutathione S-transferase